MDSERNNLRSLVRIISYIVVGFLTMPFLYNSSSQIITKFLESSVSFDIDTLYPNWNTTFPAITICETRSNVQLQRIRDTFFPNTSIYAIDDLITDTIYFRGTCEGCGNCSLETCPDTLIYEATNMRLKCEELIFNCAYREEFLSCCDFFKPIHTEYGICYAFNSNQAEENIEHRLFMNRSTDTVSLLFEVYTSIEIFVHGVNEVPNFYSKDILVETVRPGSKKELWLQLMEVYNNPDVVDLPIDLRHCRFELETVKWSQMKTIYPFYSYSTCIVECTLQLHMEYCNCTQHYLSNAVKPSTNFNVTICDYKGLSCLSKNYEFFNRHTKSCFCLSSCTETDFDIVLSSADNDNESPFDESHVVIGILNLPKERYVRHVQRNYLDLLISFGGLLGLFFNTSIVRILEILFEIILSIYYLVHKIIKFRQSYK